MYSINTIATVAPYLTISELTQIKEKYIKSEKKKKNLPFVKFLKDLLAKLEHI